MTLNHLPESDLVHIDCWSKKRLLNFSHCTCDVMYLRSANLLRKKSFHEYLLVCTARKRDLRVLALHCLRFCDQFNEAAKIALRLFSRTHRMR